MPDKSAEEIEKLPGKKDSDGFYRLEDGTFYDPDGYFFDEDGFDACGGYYNQDQNGIFFYVDPDTEYLDNNNKVSNGEEAKQGHD